MAKGLDIAQSVDSPLKNSVVEARGLPRWPWGPIHWNRLAAITWGILVVLALSRAYLRPHPQGSYPIFEGAGRSWCAGLDLYDRLNLNSLSVYRYSPPVAVLLAPLSKLSTPTGNFCLRAAKLIVLLAGLLWWARTFVPVEESAAETGKRGQRRGLLLFMTALLVCNPIMDVQLTLMTIGLSLTAVTAVARQRWNLGALSISLAILLKAYPISLALVLCVLFPRRFAGRFVLMFALCLAAPFLFQSSDYIVQQYRDWWLYGLNVRYIDNYFQDMHRFWHVWFAPISRQTYQLMEAVGGAAVAVACLIHARRGLSREELCLTAFCACTAWMMALGPATEPTTYSVLAPAAAAAVILCRTQAHPRWYRAAVHFAFTTLLLAQWQYAFDVDDFGRPIDQLAGRPFAALVLLVAVSIRAVKIERKSSASCDGVAVSPVALAA